MRRFALLAAALLLPALALGQDVVAADLDVTALLGAFVRAIQTGQWPVVAVLGFVVAIWVLRKVGGHWIPWLTSSEGGTVLALLTTIASVLGAAALAGTPVTWALLGSASAAGFAAIGGYVGVRRLLRLLVPLAAKVPKIGPALSKILSALSGADVAAKVQAATAEAYRPAGPTTSSTAADALSKPPIP